MQQTRGKLYIDTQIQLFPHAEAIVMINVALTQARPGSPPKKEYIKSIKSTYENLGPLQGYLSGCTPQQPYTELWNGTT